MFWERDHSQITFITVWFLKWVIVGHLLLCLIYTLNVTIGVFVQEKHSMYVVLYLQVQTSTVHLEMYPPQIRREGDGYCDPVFRCSLLSKDRLVCVTSLRRINYWFLRNLRVKCAFLGFAWMAPRRFALLTALESSATHTLLQSHLELKVSPKCQLFLCQGALSFCHMSFIPPSCPFLP